MRVGLFHRISEFCRDERGNDLLELALVAAFVLLGSTALYTSAGADVQSMLQYPGREVVHVHHG
jgi:Flp pilus assembly protein TadG